MADASDVEIAIAQIVTAALYPTGSGNPSINGLNYIIERGWPMPGALDAQMTANTVVVSVFGQNGVERNTTRFSTDVQTLNIPAPTVTATIAGQTITFAGTLPAPQNIGVTLGDWSPAYKSVIYPALITDTMTTIAAGLAALLVAQGVAATSAGPVLTLPATAIASALVGVFGTQWQEIKRQERAWMVTIWCKTPAVRDQVGPIIDIALCQSERLLLADGSGARMKYERTNISDDRQTTDIFRRDFVYFVEYATTIITQAPTIISTNAAVAGSQ